jgi:hypothetical protein
MTALLSNPLGLKTAAVRFVGHEFHPHNQQLKFSIDSLKLFPLQGPLPLFSHLTYSTHLTIRELDIAIVASQKQHHRVCRISQPVCRVARALWRSAALAGGR